MDVSKEPAVLKSVLQAAFDAVNRRDVDGIMSNWSSAGVYDNPMVGHAATGTEAVRQCMVALVNAVGSKNQFLVVDRMSEGPSHVIAEWHVEPPDGRRGVHVADFDDTGKLKSVTVYPRAS